MSYTIINNYIPESLSPQLQSLLLIGYFNNVEMELLDTNQLKQYLAVSGKHLKPASLAHRIRIITH